MNRINPYKDLGPFSHSSDIVKSSAYEEGVKAVIEEFKSKGVKSLIQTDGVYAMCELSAKGDLKGTSVRALICKMSESKEVAPISLNKKRGWLVFIPEEE